MEVECRASFLALSYVAKLLGKTECNEASEEEKELMRFLTPLLKLYTAKQVFILYYFNKCKSFDKKCNSTIRLKSVSVVSEGLEAIGGQGYIEDTGLPTYFRDAQVYLLKLK